MPPYGTPVNTPPLPSPAPPNLVSHLIESVTSIKDLVSDRKNARKRTDNSTRLIQESLQRYGAARSIVIDEDNRILAGNGTIDGAKALGLTKLKVIEAAGDEIIAVRRTGLSEDDKVGLALADNRTSDLSDWDKDMLQQLSAEHDLAPWFDADDLAEILGEVEQLSAEGLTDADDVPEAPEEPVTKLGDLWVLGDHRLLCGDSTDTIALERLMDGGKADMVFTDPPYGMKLNTDWSQEKKDGNPLHSKLKGGKAYAQIKGDHADFSPDLIQAIWASFPDVAEVFVFGADYFAEFLPNRNDGSWVVWDKCTTKDGATTLDKGQGSNFELCWSKQRHKRELARVLHKGLFSCENDKRVHPTQKPVALAEWFFERWGQGKTVVVDLYGGSGSTLIACEKTSRHCRMMELDPRYCDVIVKRWEDFTGQTAICFPSEAHFTEEQEAA